MRVSLDPNAAEFAKQVAALRAFFNEQGRMTGQPAVSARLMLACVPALLLALRTELRDEVVPEQVLTACADLIANIAKTAVQTMLDAPPLAIAETVEQLLTQATVIACQGIAQEAQQGKPMLSVVPQRDPGAAEPATVLHMPQKPTSKREH